MSLEQMEVMLRSARLRAGLSQGELALRAGVTRQAISAIEMGRTAPTMPVALRCARALGLRVDEIFRLVDELPEASATLIDAADLPPGEPFRVQVAAIGDRVVARPMLGATGMLLTLPRANGLVRRHDPRSATVSVELFDEPTRIDRTLVLVGCDPSMSLLVDQFRRRHPGLELVCQPGNSSGALESVSRNEAHVAGLHLFDPASRSFNETFARRALGADVHLVGYAIWQEGLLVAHGNPLSISEVADLARSEVRFVNREVGSGARALLDDQLQRAGVNPSRVHGYDRVVRSHLASAEAVASGLADVAVGVQVAAQSLRLGFIPLAEERYDLAIPARFYALPIVQALLETLLSPMFRREIEAFGGYDVSQMGTLVSAA